MSRRDRASKNGLFQLLRRICAKAVRTITAVIRNTRVSSALPTADNRSERRIMRTCRISPALVYSSAPEAAGCDCAITPQPGRARPATAPRASIVEMKQA